jgi:hypothetical protein
VIGVSESLLVPLLIIIPRVFLMYLSNFLNSQETCCISVILKKINFSMKFSEIITLYSENHTEHKNTFHSYYTGL